MDGVGGGVAAEAEITRLKIRLGIGPGSPRLDRGTRAPTHTEAHARVVEAEALRAELIDIVAGSEQLPSDVDAAMQEIATLRRCFHTLAARHADDMAKLQLGLDALLDEASAMERAHSVARQAWTRAFQYQRHYVEVTAMQRQRRHARELAAAKEALQHTEEQLASRDDREQQLTQEAEALISQHVAAARIQRGYHRYCSAKDSRTLIRAHAMQSRKSAEELSEREFKLTQLEAQLAARHESPKREGSTVEQDALITKLAADLEQLREQHKAALAATDTVDGQQLEQQWAHLEDRNRSMLIKLAEIEELVVGQQQARSGDAQAHIATRQAWTRAFQYQRHYVEVTAMQRQRRHARELAAAKEALQHTEEQLASRDDREQQLTQEAEALISQHVAASRKSAEELSEREFKLTQLEAQLAARHESPKREGSTVEQDALITKLEWAHLEDRNRRLLIALAEMEVRNQAAMAPLKSPHGTQKLDRVEPRQPRGGLATTATATRTKVDAVTRNERLGERRSVSRESIKRSSEALLRRLADAEAAAHANVHSSSAAMQLTFSTIQQHQHQMRSAAQAASGI